MKPNSFNWSKIHLVYFVLASCDLLAVLFGLWISEFTKTKFEEATHRAQYSNLVRNDSSAIMAAAIDLSQPANAVFQSKDFNGERRKLKRYSDAFDTAMGTTHMNPDTASALIAEMPGELTFDQKMQLEDSGLKYYFPDNYQDIKTIELSLRNKKAAMVWQSEQAIAALESGDSDKAGKLMDQSDAIFRGMLASLNALYKQSGAINDQVAQQSQQNMNFSTSLQYLVGSFIVLMVCFVCAYGFFVGKILKKKYKDLEVANTESAKFNEQLQGVNDDVTRLNASLAANMEQLRLAQDEIIRKGKMAQLGQLTATVAHEIRNPLGAARTSAYLLERKIKGKGLGGEPQVDRINAAITRCDNIITQLLDFSRARSAQCQELSIDDWLTKIVEEEVQKLPASIAVTLELDAAEKKVRFDPDRMQRVIVNLIHNASEAMSTKGKDGSSNITVDPRIIIRCRVDSGSAIISVKDNGPGIAPDVLPKILDPLFTTKSFGTGLGLPAVENILHQHGGKLEVVSLPEQGAEFIARWPVDGPPAQDSALAA